MLFFVDHAFFHCGVHMTQKRAPAVCTAETLSAHVCTTLATLDEVGIAADSGLISVHQGPYCG